MENKLFYLLAAVFAAGALITVSLSTWRDIELKHKAEESNTSAKITIDAYCIDGLVFIDKQPVFKGFGKYPKPLKCE